MFSNSLLLRSDLQRGRNAHFDIFQDDAAEMETKLLTVCDADLSACFSCLGLLIDCVLDTNQHRRWLV